MSTPREQPHRHAYTPYGTTRGVISPTLDGRGYLNQPTDPATNYDLLGARNYDPTTGRFLQADPILEATDPNQLGGYTYSADDPVNTSDPTGLMGYDDTTGIGAGDTAGQLQHAANDAGISQYTCTPSTCSAATIIPDVLDAERYAARMQAAAKATAEAQQRAQQAAMAKHSCSGFFGCLGHDFSSAVDAVGDGIVDGVKAIGDYVDANSTTLGYISLGLAIAATVLTLGASTPLLAGVAAMEIGGFSSAAIAAGGAMAIDVASAATTCAKHGNTGGGCGLAIASVAIDGAGFGVAKPLARALEAGMKPAFKVDAYGVRYATNVAAAAERNANGVAGLSLLAGTLGDFCAGQTWCTESR